ncbi:Leucine-, isoleucine-, valine-, threonine-, and alanine-binding protein [subsurface metagenome]
MKRLIMRVMVAALVLSVGGLGTAVAQQQPEEVRIGALWPLTGAMPQIGAVYKSACDLFEDLVNNSYDIDSPGDIIRSEGLPNLGGAKIKFIYGDSMAKPDVCRAETERLITVEKVHALIGCECSGVTLTGSATAERYGIPWINALSSSASLHERGLRWFFRTGPHAGQLGRLMLDFVAELDKRRPDVEVETVGIVYEDTEWGQDFANVIRKLAEEYGYKVVVDVPYPHEATDVDAEVLAVKKANPDVIYMASYYTDAILFQKTCKRYDVNKPIIGDDTGHVDVSFGESLGPDANYVIARDYWSDSMVETLPIAKKIDDLLKKRGVEAGMDLFQAGTYVCLLTLADAINRAGSTDPEAIRQALVETDIPQKYLSVAWQGVKFNEKGQNIYGGTLIKQWQDEDLKVVWPWDVAEAEVIWHLPSWSER